jgi:hypothetical protein
LHFVHSSVLIENLELLKQSQNLPLLCKKCNFICMKVSSVITQN